MSCACSSLTRHLSRKQAGPCCAQLAHRGLPSRRQPSRLRSPQAAPSSAPQAVGPPLPSSALGGGRPYRPWFRPTAPPQRVSPLLHRLHLGEAAGHLALLACAARRRGDGARVGAQHVPRVLRGAVCAEARERGELHLAHLVRSQRLAEVDGGRAVCGRARVGGARVGGAASEEDGGDTAHRVQAAHRHARWSARRSARWSAGLSGAPAASGAAPPAPRRPFAAPRAPRRRARGAPPPHGAGSPAPPRVAAARSLRAAAAEPATAASASAAAAAATARSPGSAAGRSLPRAPRRVAPTHAAAAARAAAAQRAS